VAAFAAPDQRVGDSMRTCLVGHFRPSREMPDAATSAAGEQVQRQILAELIRLVPAGEVIAYSMAPSQAWPRGPLVRRSSVEGRTRFIGYFNLPVLRHLVFSLRLLRLLAVSRPRVCLSYNSYFFENLALLVSRGLFGPQRLAMVLQDLLILDGVSLYSRAGLRSRWERAALWAVRRFDVLVPVSDRIVEDFGFDRARCFVFQGGITDFAARIAESPVPPYLQPIGLFAGMLEPYNGLDRLLRRWVTGAPPGVLHVFGHGSLAVAAASAAANSPYIVFHGQQPPEQIEPWLRVARWNFCLRYDVGLNQAYFFPSKLFNIVCAAGLPVVNDFAGLPADLREHLCVVDDDLEDLFDRIGEFSERPDRDAINGRRAMVLERHSWRSCVARILERCRYG
jgi:glycosyltransferase involved in cell wall biosynthesis